MLIRVMTRLAWRRLTKQRLLRQPSHRGNCFPMMSYFEV